MKSDPRDTKLIIATLNVLTFKLDEHLDETD